MTREDKEKPAPSQLKDFAIAGLFLEYQKFCEKLYGEENDGRTTSSGSANIDYWCDMMEKIEEEVTRRVNENN